MLAILEIEGCGDPSYGDMGCAVQMRVVIIRVVHLLFFSVVGERYAEGYRAKNPPTHNLSFA
jgi:hypothetical protein